MRGSQVVLLFAVATTSCKKKSDGPGDNAIVAILWNAGCQVFVDPDC